MFHAQISWNKKRVKTKTENKSAASVPKSKDSTIYIIKLENGCKRQIRRFQAFLLYIRYARTLQYRKTAAKVVFEGCKGAKIGKTYISTQ